MDVSTLNASQLKRECDRRLLAHGKVADMRERIVTHDKSNPMLAPYNVIMVMEADRMNAQRLRRECTARGIQSKGLPDRTGANCGLRTNLSNAEMRNAIVQFDTKCMKDWCLQYDIYRPGMTVSDMIDASRDYRVALCPLPLRSQ